MLHTSQITYNNSSNNSNNVSVQATAMAAKMSHLNNNTNNNKNNNHNTNNKIAYCWYCTSGRTNDWHGSWNMASSENSLTPISFNRSRLSFAT